VYYVAKMDLISIEIQRKYKEHIVAYLSWVAPGSADCNISGQKKSPDYML
jgi:hypothetical protein